MSADARAPDDGALRVLAASQDHVTLGIIDRTMANAGHDVHTSSDLARAVATATTARCEVAFVDVMLDGGAGLALVHHLTAAIPGIAVYALAPELSLELGSQAVALGAAGFVSSPPSGDALIHAVDEVRARHGAAREKQKLEADLALARRRNALSDRLVSLANGSTPSEVASAVIQILAEIGDAHGAALYTDSPGAACVRLAAIGTGTELPSAAPHDELLRAVGARGSHVLPLVVGDKVHALAILEQADPARDSDVSALANLASTILAFVEGAQRARDRDVDVCSRVYSFSYLEDIAGREVEKARRHGRRLAIASIVLDKDSATNPRGELEQIVLGVVRETDVLARVDDHEFFLLLPETGALGAHACRRRLLIRAEGDRRARTPASDRRGPVASRPGRGLPLSIGVAAYPHDGASLERLLRSARQRARNANDSVVHSLGLAPLSLGEIIDVLLARPMMGAGVGSPYPLDLVAPAMLSLVASACREARRGGASSLLVTARAGMGMASAAREVFARDAKDPSVQVVDVRNAPRCENAEAIVLSAEHGSWVCCGRRDDDRFRGVHAADPLLADLIAQRLTQSSGARWP